METREQTEAREKKLVDDTKRLAQSGLRKLGINIQNPLAGLDTLGEPEYDEVNRKENWAGPVVKGTSTDVLSQIAIGKVPQKSLVPKLPPRSDGRRMINVTPKKANEIVKSVFDYRVPKGSLTNLTTGSLGLMHPNYRPPNVMYSTGVNPEPFKQEYVEPTAIEIADKINHTMKWWGNKNLFYGKERKFNLGAFRNSLTSDQKRSFAIIYSTTPHTEIGLSWDDHRKLLVDGFTSLYGDAMQKYNYSPEDIEIDHLYTLVQSMPIYSDLSLTDPLYHKIQKRLLSASYKPGNAESNLGALDPQTHRVKTAYYNKLHGPNGNRFFTPERVEYMKKGETERMEVLEDYIEAVNEGTRIMNEGQAVWDTFYSKNEILPEELAERLAPIQVGPNGELRQYPTPRLRDLITEIVKDYPVNKEPPNILELAEQFKDYNPELDVFLRSDPAALEKLAFRIQGGTTAEMKKIYKNYNPDQMELIFNKLTGPQVTAIMRAYGYGGKKDLPKKGLNLDDIMRKDE